MRKTAILLTIVLCLTAIHVKAQNNPEALTPVAPVTVEVNTQKEARGGHQKTNTLDSETVHQYNTVDLKEHFDEIETDLQRNENRKRRPIARLLFLAAIVVVIILLI